MMPQWKTMGALVLIGLWLGACATIGDQAGGPKDDPTAGPSERHYALGKKFLEQSKFSDALAEFEQAIALNPNNVSAFEGIALVHLGLGNLAKAEEMAETAQALNRKVPLLKSEVTPPARPRTTPVGVASQERPRPSAPPDLSSGLAATRKFAASQERPRPASPAVPTSARQAPVLPDRSDATRLYLQALESYDHSRYEDAERLFRQFRRQYPHAPQAGNAQYWLGESLYALQQYGPAIVAFDDLIGKYPQDSKAPAAMLKEGLAFAALRDSRNARYFLQQVLKKYPDSPEAIQAAATLKQLPVTSPAPATPLGADEYALLQAGERGDTTTQTTPGASAPEPVSRPAPAGSTPGPPRSAAAAASDTPRVPTPGPSIPKAGTRVEDRPEAGLAPPPPLASDVDQFVQKASECAQPDPRKWAVVVGIERYLQGNIPAVPFARHDAMIVKEYVRKLLCVPAKNLVFLLDDRATLTQVRLHLDNRLPAWVKEGHTVFFYFVGHGVTADRHPYLVPYDGDPLAPQTSGYAIRALYSSLDRLQGAQVHVYLDACFSGGTRSGEPLLPGGPRPAILEVEDPVLLSHKLVVLTAARGNQLSYSFEEQGHGLFTYYLLKGLMGDAAGTVRKQPVTVKALAEYVTQQVSEQARSLFGLESPQEPVLQPTPPRERGEWVLREMR